VEVSGQIYARTALVSGRGLWYPLGTENLTDASKEVCLEISTAKTDYMSLSRHHNAVQNDDIKIANRSFENVAQFRYLGTTVR
jgi:hypothetical protein